MQDTEFKKLITVNPDKSACIKCLKDTPDKYYKKGEYYTVFIHEKPTTVKVIPYAIVSKPIITVFNQSQFYTYFEVV